MDFVRRLVGSTPKRKPLAPPPRPDVSLDRSADQATTYRPVPQIDPAPVESASLGDSASRGRPDQLTMLGVAPVDEPLPSGDTATHPRVSGFGEQPEGSEAATVYMQIPPDPEPEAESEPPPRRQIATLTATDGELAGQVFAVLEGENQLGRAPDSDVVLPSRFISRVHIRLICEDGKITLVPVSDPLTLLHGSAATEQEVHDGDEIQLGHTKLQVRIES